MQKKDVTRDKHGVSYFCVVVIDRLNVSARGSVMYTSKEIPFGSSHGRGHCVMFKTLYSHSASLQKWVPANSMLGGNPAMDKYPIQGGVEILSVASCYRNQDKLRPDGPLGSYADFFTLFENVSFYLTEIKLFDSCLEEIFLQHFLTSVYSDN